jgi:RimJ/RimL family protein N-acetyltransferase
MLGCTRTRRENDVIRGEKVFLSALGIDDVRPLYMWANDRDLATLSRPYAPIHWDDHVEWFENQRRDKTGRILGIRLTNGEKLIGFCKLIGIHPIHRSAEMQMKIGREEYRSKGYGSEALKLLLDFAWNDLALRRVSCCVYADNDRAIKAYEKVGFEREGLMRKAVFVDGKTKDLVVMGILNPAGS